MAAAVEDTHLAAEGQILSVLTDENVQLALLQTDGHLFQR